MVSLQPPFLYPLKAIEELVVKNEKLFFVQESLSLPSLNILVY